MHYCSNGNGVYIFSINRSSLKEQFSRSMENMHYCRNLNGVYIFSINHSSFKEQFSRSREKYALL